MHAATVTNGDLKNENGSVDSSFGNASKTREKKKTKRRTANEIVKQYQCLFCAKRFGSEAANIMHMRKKHNMGTKTEMLKNGERKLIGFDPHSVMGRSSMASTNPGSCKVNQSTGASNFS